MSQDSVDSEFIHLELSELIQMNRLIRGKIDLTGFYAWFDVLAAPKQVSLLWHLYEFAAQARYDEAMFEQALESTQLSAIHPLVRQFRSFRYDAERYEWLLQRTDEERKLLLPLLVFLFGYAEGRVYVRESEAGCNHWWHRDLLDERVVQDLLNDPHYYRTSMKSDRAVKQRSQNPT